MDPAAGEAQAMRVEDVDAGVGVGVGGLGVVENDNDVDDALFEDQSTIQLQSLGDLGNDSARFSAGLN